MKYIGYAAYNEDFISLASKLFEDMGKDVVGSIATFNDINMITKSEHKIRHKVLAKGSWSYYSKSKEY